MDRILSEQRSLLEAPPVTCRVSQVVPESLMSALGVVYVHTKTDDGGDLYLTRYGLPYAEHLAVANWYERRWFRLHRERLEGTSCVYRVPTRPVRGVVLDLVVKNCRVGEDVPLDTHTLEEFINAQFNSPWEEFALVMEMREGRYGPPELRIRTQEPLAIYVPPGRMQKWQTGRSRSRINRIRARHPGIDLDILRQYKLVYGWIRGADVVEAFTETGLKGDVRAAYLERVTRKAIADMERKGYAVADMKPQHVIIDAADMERCRRMIGQEGGGSVAARDYLVGLVDEGRYSVVDYELLVRTDRHQREVQHTRRHSYLDCQRDRFSPTTVPLHLKPTEVMGVPYIFGHVESTGGNLWVVGRNARLFDYFLPERWRKTPQVPLSENNEVNYTLSKDNVHLVWKTSRVGELPRGVEGDPLIRAARRRGFNSPFEEARIVQDLTERGIGTVYLRAIYMAGSRKVEKSEDRRRYTTHRRRRTPDGAPVLRARHNYITVWGYFNGPDEWVAQNENPLLRPVSLERAVCDGIMGHRDYAALYRGVLRDLRDAGYDGSLLGPNDLLIGILPDDTVFTRADGSFDVRICSLDLIAPL